MNWKPKMNTQIHCAPQISRENKYIEILNQNGIA